jgi:phage gpG-like protein
MTGTAINLKLNAGPLLGHLARLSARKDWTAARRDIGEYLIGDIQDNFDKQKLFDGAAMPQSKAAIKRAGKTLIDDHHLYDDYAYQLVRGGLEVGSNKVYAAIHHFGGETGGRGHRFRMLARPVMGIATRQELQIGYLLIQAIKDIEAAK